MKKLEVFRNLMNIDGKVALIAGGAGEIGKAICLGLSTYGCKVILTGRNKKSAEKVAESIQKSGGKAEGRKFVTKDAAAVES